MTCKQCGTVVNENQSFCACCGAPLDPPAEPASRNPEPAPDPSLWPDDAHSMNGGKPDGERPKKKPAIVQKSGRKARERKNGGRALWIILPIAALLLIAAAVFIILFLIKDKDIEPAGTDHPAVSEPASAGKTNTSQAEGDPKATEVPTVSFRDPAFETAFRQAYSLTDDIRITDVLAVTELRLPKAELTDISDLALFENLTSLYLEDNGISDISVLQNLKGLTRLKLARNEISDISVLEKLPALAELDIEGNAVEDVSVLGRMTGLRRLFLSGNPVADPSVLKDLNGLTALSLAGAKVADLSFLAGMTELTDLRLSDNAITDISVLREMKHLTRLELSNNRAERSIKPFVICRKNFPCGRQICVPFSAICWTTPSPLSLSFRPMTDGSMSMPVCSQM